MSISLSPRALELLGHLATVPGSDIWSFDQATAGRELEQAKLVRIVKAREKPAGHLRQPYFGIKINRAGRNWLSQAQSKR